MPKHKNLQTSMSAGELSPGLGMRQDTDQYANGLKSARNRRCMIEGGTKRRPGTWWNIDLPGRVLLAPFVVNQNTKYVVAFGAERVDFYAFDSQTKMVTAAGSLTGCPWSASNFSELDFAQSGNTMFVTHVDFPTQVISRTGPSSWARSAFSYFIGPASRPEQPYLKMADQSVTLRPSDLTGSITLTLGGTLTPFFGASHVGQYIRYLQKACLITAVAGNGLSCTATVVETLPDTQDLTVASSAHFAVGEVVAGSVTGAKGIITAIGGSTAISVVITDALTTFTTADTLIGPNGTTTISDVASASTKGAVTDWDEQLFGPVYGYPGVVKLHRNRLLFAGHESAPDYLIGSALNNLYNFNVGDASDGDAFIESVGDAGASRIVQLYSAEQLLVMTDKGPYYCPENASNPFRPSSLAFFPFGSPWPISATARALAFDDGVLMVSGSLIIKARPTGDQSRSWVADEVSLLSNHLVKNPAEFAVTSNFSGGPERYAVFRNEDGTLAVMQLVEAQKIRNFTPWDTNGTIISVTAIGGDLFQAVVRQIAGDTRYILERYDQDVTLDCATEYASLDHVESRYGSTTVNVVAGRYHLGTLPLSLPHPPAGPYVVGLFYETLMETLPPVISGPEGDHAGETMRIVECYVDVVGSQRFAADGYVLQAYDVTDDLSEPPPSKEGPQRFQFLGWEVAPTIKITQPDPLPLHIRSIKTTVAF